MISEKTLFAQDVESGLALAQKTIPSMYFYDQKGEALFRKIMNLDTYYLTNSELEILSEQGGDIAGNVPSDGIDIIELGAGDGIKTKEFLKHLHHPDNVFRPIDISEDAIRDISSKMNEWLPNLEVNGICGDYFQMLNDLTGDKQKLILFLGSNLGNMLDHQAQKFLEALGQAMNPGDQLLLGLDLIKSKEIVLPAYKDREGVTTAFNMNLLERMNRELGARFELDQFEHIAEYTEKEGIVKSFLKSKITQEVEIEGLECSITFQEGEMIHTEVSRKYNEDILRGLIKNTSLVTQQQFSDKKGYFTDFLLIKE